MVASEGKGALYWSRFMRTMSTLDAAADCVVVLGRRVCEHVLWIRNPHVRHSGVRNSSACLCDIPFLEASRRMFENEIRHCSSPLYLRQTMTRSARSIRRSCCKYIVDHGEYETYELQARVIISKINHRNVGGIRSCIPLSRSAQALHYIREAIRNSPGIGSFRSVSTSSWKWGWRKRNSGIHS